MICYSYVPWNNHKSSSHPSSHRIFSLVMRNYKIHSLSNFQICNMVLLTRVSMLYIIAMGFTEFICFITGSLYSPTSFIFQLFLPTFHPLPMVITNVISVSISRIFFCCCFLGFTYEWDHMVFVFLCSVWFISLSMILSRSIQFVTNGSFILFYGWIISYCVYTTFSLSIQTSLNT